ncbi:MAG TPA: peptide-methionine (S)-S-oxide reductase MsrA [Chitinophagaceae bacterium]|nr:peptide-methionine (S)-S-oxide reductase MsrA [Chitinophagaceae bacterium]
MKKIALSLISFLIIFSMVSCQAQKQKRVKQKTQVKDLSKFSQATFASGCFWCVEAVFESVKGVVEAESGYSGGVESNPTYEQVSAHGTKHAETVQVYYDPSIISYSTLLKVYFASQNPTQVNGQGPDNGESYRSIIFYRNANEKMQAEKYITELQKKYKQPIAAELLPFKKFWLGEDYHQNYVNRNPNVGYVRGESIPRIKRFQKQYPELIKPDHKF